MSRVPAGLCAAFGVCAGELGMFSAARVFVRELLLEPDEALAAEAAGALGESYPVFDVVAARAFARREVPAVSAAAVAAEVGDLSRLVVVGIEAHCLEALLPEIPGVRVAVLPDLTHDADLDRVRANLGERVELSERGTCQRWAGRSTGLLTIVYGADGFRATVCQAWLRAHGPDVRPRFRKIVGWNVLGPKMEAYPRWLGETDASDFAPLVGPEGRAR